MKYFLQPLFVSSQIAPFSLFLLFFLRISSPLFATQIPDSLLKNANLVIVSEEEVFEVKALDKAIGTHKKRVLVLNEGGLEKATSYCAYDKFRSVSGMKGTIYDLMGQEIRKITANEIKDISLGESAIANDNRVKYIEPAYSKYPFILETEYEVSYKTLMFFPTWMPQNNYAIAVLHAEFKVICPKPLSFRYSNHLIPQDEKISDNGLVKKVTWTIDNLVAKKKEAYAPHFQDIVPIVYTAPVDFQMGDFTGKMNTWEDIGKWYYQLNKDRDIVSSQMTEKLTSLTANTTDSREKVRIIYEFMQSQTRYVNINLGIGGWQTAPASDLEKNGYGDCKALSNYAKAMLKAVGITAYPAIIRAGDDAAAVLPDFPCMHFNHVILCVPLEKDTIWLECTSQREKMGFLGTFTDNRYALLTLPEGSKLLKTTEYKHEINVTARHIAIQIAENGNGLAQISSVYKGQVQEETGASYMYYQSNEKQKEWLQKDLSFGNYSIDDFSFSTSKDLTPHIAVACKLQLPAYGTKSGKRMFIPVNVLSAISAPAPNSEARINPLVISSAKSDLDTILISLPPNYKVESLIKNVEIHNEFGEYSLSCKEENGQITYIRRFVLWEKEHDKSLYPAFQEYLKTVAKSDKAKIVLVGVE